MNQSVPSTTATGPTETAGGELLSSKATSAESSLQQQPFAKSQFKKPRKPQSKQQSMHYKEKEKLSPPHEEAIRKETTSLISEGITKESAVEQQQTQRFPLEGISAVASRAGKESPILSEAKQVSGSTFTQPQQPISTEPPLWSPEEKARQLQARREVDRLEEAERRDRIERARQEDVKEKARREANLMGTVRAEEEERKRRIDEDNALDAREGESEASLIGTVIDEENERRRRIEEEYETFTEPLGKTKAMEEIERRRRIHSHAEQARQRLAASASATLFPHAPRPSMSANSLWTSHGLLKQTQPSLMKQVESPPPRYGAFIATTTRTKSAHLLPAGESLVEKKPFMPPYSSTPSEITIKASVMPRPEASSQLETSSIIKVSKETYQSKTRPRLVVHHSGLTGKWKRATETVELHEGVDY